VYSSGLTLALEAGEITGKQPKSSFPKGSCYVPGLVLDLKMSMAWSDRVVPFMKREEMQSDRCGDYEGDRQSDL
jgi:hypothetical protein